MTFDLLIAFSILFIGIPGIINYSFRKNTNRIMNRVNPKFTGHINNPIDFFRIISAYINNYGLVKKERATLRLSIMLVSISWIAGIIILISIIFYSEQILN